MPTARQRGRLVYKVSILPVAKRDLEEIVRYLSDDLRSPDTAERVASAIVDGIRILSPMPYRRRAYVPIRPLGHEHRSLRAGSHLVFYWIEEHPSPSAVVARVLYGASDARNRLGRED